MVTSASALNPEKGLIKRLCNLFDGNEGEYVYYFMPIARIETSLL
jgi:hypothetical protein